MEKCLLKWKKDKIGNIIILYLLMQPILDIITGITTKHLGNTFSLGVILRTLFMIGIAIYALYCSSSPKRKKLIIYFGIIAFYIVCFLSYSYHQFSFASIFIQIKGLIKSFYLPIVLVSLFTIYSEKKIKIDNKILVYTLLIYTFTIFIGKITGLGYRSYNTIKESFGTVGFFYAANEIGAIICTLAPFFILQLLQKKGNLIGNLILLALLIFAVTEIGTKVPFIGITGLLIGYVIVGFILFFHHKDKTYLIHSFGIILLLIVIYFVMGYTPLGKNLNMDYGNIFPRIFSNQSITPSTTIDSIADLQEALSSKRDIVLNRNQEKFLDGNMLHLLLGIGYLNSFNGTVEETKLVEMDYHDILFNHGIFGSILILLPLIILLYYVCQFILLHIKKVFVHPEIIFGFYAIMISLCIAGLAGHVLTAPAACIWVIVALIKLYSNNQQLEEENVKGR